MNNIKRIDFEFGCYDSDGKIIEGTEEWVSVLYNENVITEEEVKKLIFSEDYEFDTRVVITTVERADNLRG